MILHPILQGIDLLSVAIHEIGHVIGLPPSNISESVMYPIFDQRRHELYERDHEAVKKLFENIKSDGRQINNFSGVWKHRPLIISIYGIFKVRKLAMM